MRILNITTLSALAVLLITAGCNDSSNNNSANEEPEVIVKKPIKKTLSSGATTPRGFRRLSL